MIAVTRNYNGTVQVTTRHAHDDITSIIVSPANNHISAQCGIWTTTNTSVEYDTPEHRAVQLTSQFIAASEKRTHDEIAANPTCNDGWDNYRGEPVTREEKAKEIEEIAGDLIGALLDLTNDSYETVPAGFWSQWGKLNRSCREVKCQFRIADRVWKALRDAVWITHENTARNRDNGIAVA